MTTTTDKQPLHLGRPSAADDGQRPSPLRRMALAATAFVSCAMPVVFTANVTRMLLTGVDTDHRFHQGTGQGLVLFALWLGPLLAMVRAGWRGRRPASALGWQHVLFVAIGLVCSAIAPGGGAPFLTGVIAVTGGLLWLALPHRPRVRVPLQVHPVLAPIALLGAAVLTPYAVRQLAAQNDVSAGYHATNPHLFDMGWMALCLVGLALAAALSPVLRGLMTWFAGCAAVVGAAGLVFGEGSGWSVMVLGLGVVAAAAVALTRRVERTRTALARDGRSYTARHASCAASRGPPSGRRRAGLAGGGAIVVASLAVVAAGAGLAVTTVGDAWGLPAAPQLAVDAVVGLSCPVVAAVMLAAGRLSVGARRLAGVLLVAGTASALTALTTGLALTATSASTLARSWSQLQSFLWVPGFLPLITLVPLLYPDGLPSPRRRWRVAAAASTAGVALLTVGLALYDEPLLGRVVVPKLVTQPVVAQGFAVAAAALLVPSVLAALVAIVIRLRTSRGLARRQVAVLVAAVVVLAVVTGAQGLLPSPVDVLLQAAAVGLVPVAIGVAVTRHRLYDLDLAVRRVLAVASLLACLAGAFIALVALADAVLSAVGLGASRLSVAIAAGLTGAALQPLGRQLTAGIDRLYFGYRSDPYLVTSRLGTQLAAAAGDVAQVPHLVCATVVEQLRLRGARVVLPGGRVTSEVAAAGDVPDVPALQLDLRHRGQVVGQLQVAARDGQEKLQERDVVVLQAVADLAAPALAALTLQRDLQRSRESIVAAREAERRRLRHDLHDGLGASLAGLRLQIETAQDLVAGSPAASLLDAAGVGVATAVAEVRTIVDGLRPPGIDDLGLVGALTALADRLNGSGVQIELCVDDDLDLDPAIEVAVYRIAAEALTNVVRHASASRVVLHAHADRAVELVVSDDGLGLRLDDASSGVGLSSMRQRAEEVGGRLEVRPGADGGTDVHAVLPVVVGGAT